MSTPGFDLAIVGGGPVGIFAALHAVRQGSVVLVCGPPERTREVPRIETLPASVVCLLVDVGLPPRLAGIRRFHDSRQVAWSKAQPADHAGRPMAHVDHETLRTQLLAIAASTPGISIVTDPSRPRRTAAGWVASSWHATSILDASGRSMVLQRGRSGLAHPWVARPFWTHAPTAHEPEGLRIAALPFGYVYRVSSDEFDTLWVAGRGPELGGTPRALEALLRRGEAA